VQRASTPERSTNSIAFAASTERQLGFSLSSSGKRISSGSSADRQGARRVFEAMLPSERSLTLFAMLSAEAIDGAAIRGWPSMRDSTNALGPLLRAAGEDPTTELTALPRGSPHRATPDLRRSRRDRSSRTRGALLAREHRLLSGCCSTCAE